MKHMVVSMIRCSYFVICLCSDDNKSLIPKPWTNANNNKLHPHHIFRTNDANNNFINYAKVESVQKNIKDLNLLKAKRETANNNDDYFVYEEVAYPNPFADQNTLNEAINLDDY
ncbi:hypothetical protein COBT_003259, partial [Conglomerata obtusa]